MAIRIYVLNEDVKFFGGSMNEEERWIRERFEKNGYFTTWHWNDDVLIFADKFRKSIRQSMKQISYYMRKLVREGIAQGYWVGLGECGWNDFNVRRMRIWQHVSQKDL